MKDVFQPGLLDKLLGGCSFHCAIVADRYEMDVAHPVRDNLGRPDERWIILVNGAIGQDSHKLGLGRSPDRSAQQTPGRRIGPEPLRICSAWLNLYPHSKLTFVQDFSCF